MISACPAVSQSTCSALTILKKSCAATTSMRMCWPFAGRKTSDNPGFHLNHRGTVRSFFRTVLSLSVVHWLTSIGVVLTTASAVVFLVLLFQRVDNPYFGIVVFLVL